jgi:hypothetical protein
MNFLNLIDWFALAPRDGSRSLWNILLTSSIGVFNSNNGIPRLISLCYFCCRVIVVNALHK